MPPGTGWPRGRCCPGPDGRRRRMRSCLGPIDYPFAPNAKGRKFLNEVALSPADMAKLTHGNADALLKLKA